VGGLAPDRCAAHGRDLVPRPRRRTHPHTHPAPLRHHRGPWSCCRPSTNEPRSSG
jgi:hypothetical protein